MPRCANTLCKSKLPKGTLPKVCNDACRDAAIAQALHKKREADKRAQARARNLVEREAKEQRKESRRKRSDYWAGQLPHQLDLTQRVFNTMIRLLDRGKRCPTCGEPLVEGECDAGHVHTVASCPQLRYEARACFGQCRKCNGSGTIRKRTRKTQEVVSELYSAWILETFGWQRKAWIYGPHDSHDWTCEELIELRAVFAAEVARLKKGLPPSRDWRSIEQQESRLSGRTEQEEQAA